MSRYCKPAMTTTTSPSNARRLPRPSELAKFWQLEPETVYLNHGSFGATPRPVLDAQRRHIDRMERELIRWFVVELDGALDACRARLAAFVGCRAADLVFVPNATTGVATALENFPLRQGDQVLTNTHEYPACQNNLRRIAARRDAEIVSVDIPFPIQSEDRVLEVLLEKVTPRTRLALVSHVTSPSGLVLPIARIVRALRERGIETIVDGAHAPGFTEVDIAAIAPAYYTANCHKWVCSPKGSALLYVREDMQPGFQPLVLSNHAGKPKPGRSAFHTEFDYVGTTDLSAWLSIADALEFMGAIMTRPGESASTDAEIRAGFAKIREHNRSLVLWARKLVCTTLGVEPSAPESMIGSLAAIHLPRHSPERLAVLAGRPTKYHDALQDEIIRRHAIQVPIWFVAGTPERLIRLSAQVYNSREQYEYLAAALAEEVARERA